MNKDQSGSATVDAMAGILVILIVALAVMQIAWTLFGGNVVRAAAHEAVRSVVERDVADARAVPVATEVVRRSAGGMLSDIRVSVRTEGAVLPTTSVRVRARLHPPGPLPLSLPVNVTASARKAITVP